MTRKHQTPLKTQSRPVGAYVSAENGSHGFSNRSNGCRPASRPSGPVEKVEPRVVVADLCRRYSVSDWTVRTWFKSGVIRGALIDAKWSTTWDVVFAFEGRVAPRSGPLRQAAKEPLFTVVDVAAYLRVDQETVRRRFRERRLAGFKVQSSWYTDRAALNAYEASHQGHRDSGNAA